MEISYFLFLPALLIALAISVESFGALMRSLGASASLPTVGYSAHVRIATIGRVFIIGSAPLIGFFVDKYQDPKIIILIGVYTFLMSSIFHSLIVYAPILNIRLAQKIFLMFSKNQLDEVSILEKTSFKINKRVFYGSMLTVCVQSTGIFVVNAFAAQSPNLRATIVQMTGVITFLGTAVHIFLVDPVLASDCDNKNNHDITIKNYIMGRLLGNIVNFFLFTIVYFL